MIKYTFNENYKNLEIKAKVDTTVIELDEYKNPNNTFTFESDYFPKYTNSCITSIKKIPATWKNVYDITIDAISDYTPCDSVGLLVSNADTEVYALLNICGLKEDKNKIIKIERTGLQPFSYLGSLYNFIKYRMDITTIPKKKALFEYQKNCTKKKELEFFCSKEGNESYLNLIKNRNTLVEILEEFGCKLTICSLVTTCELLKPRYYTMIHNNNSKIQILLGSIKNIVDDIVINGHVTKYIENNYKKDTVDCNIPIELCYRKNMIYNNMVSSNLICFCTGTGIAPFISFYRANKYRNLRLIYGYRNESDNLSAYYKIEKDWVTLAQSSCKKRVYDYVNLLVDVVDDCDVFICGNIKMQKDVFDVIKNIYPKLVDQKKVFFDNWS